MTYPTIILSLSSKTFYKCATTFHRTKIMLSASSLRGCITALVTPFTPHSEVDYKQLETLLDQQIQAGMETVLLGGSTGEGYSLGMDEYQTLVQHAATHCRGRLNIIAGVNGFSTEWQLQIARALVDCGVDALLITSPSYCKPSQKGLYEHFSTLADEIACPQVLYNVPGRAVANLSPETTARLSNHERIIGIKEANEDLSHQLDVLALNDHQFSVMSGNDYQTLSMMVHGASGVVSVLSNVLPKAMRAMVELAARQEYAESSAEFNRLLPAMRACFIDSNPIPIKTLCAWQSGQQPIFRAPLTNMEASALAQLQEIAQIHNLNYLPESSMEAAA